MVTNLEIEEVAKKTGLEFEEVRSRVANAVIRNAACVKIAGPKHKVRIDLFSVRVLPEEAAIARKWLSDHAAEITEAPDYVDGAVDIKWLDRIQTPKSLTDIARVAKTIQDKHVRRIYAEAVRAKNKRYIKPKSPPSPNWFEIAAKENQAWQNRPRILDNKNKHRLENLRKSSKTRRNCPPWFHDDLTVFVVLLLKHSWQTRPDKIIANEIRRDLDAVKYWTYGVVPDDSPLLDLNADNIRVMVDRFRKFGKENLPPRFPWERSFENVALFLWQLLLNTSNPDMTRPFAALRRAMELSIQLLKISIPHAAIFEAIMRCETVCKVDGSSNRRREHLW